MGEDFKVLGQDHLSQKLQIPPGIPLKLNWAFFILFLDYCFQYLREFPWNQDYKPPNCKNLRLLCGNLPSQFSLFLQNSSVHYRIYYCLEKPKLTIPIICISSQILLIPAKITLRQGKFLNLSRETSFRSRSIKDILYFVSQRSPWKEKLRRSEFPRIFQNNLVFTILQGGLL